MGSGMACRRGVRAAAGGSRGEGSTREGLIAGEDGPGRGLGIGVSDGEGAVLGAAEIGTGELAGSSIC